MALYQLKPQDPIEAAQYTSGLEDGFIGFTSDTITSNPIPTELEYYAGFYTVVDDGDDWHANIPYVGDSIPVAPTDYVISSTVGDKTVMAKAEFEAKYEIFVAP